MRGTRFKIQSSGESNPSNIQNIVICLEAEDPRLILLHSPQLPFQIYSVKALKTYENYHSGPAVHS